MNQKEAIITVTLEFWNTIPDDQKPPLPEGTFYRPCDRCGEPCIIGQDPLGHDDLNGSIKEMIDSGRLAVCCMNCVRGTDQNGVNIPAADAFRYSVWSGDPASPQELSDLLDDWIERKA